MLVLYELVEEEEEDSGRGVIVGCDVMVDVM
jgi:hypothetical protein